MNYQTINLVGIEIEGMWNTMPPCGEIVYDGSVRFDGRKGVRTAGIGDPIDYDGPLIGEVVSPPRPPGELRSWVADNYPDKVNNTCGLHVHYSMPIIKYQSMMDSYFYEYFRERMEEWGRNVGACDDFWDRLRGNVLHCRDEFVPDKQIHGAYNRDIRRTAWNFCAFKAHGTAECRVLPAFPSAEDSVEAITYLHNIVESFITNQKPPEPIKVNIGYPAKGSVQTKTF